MRVTASALLVLMAVFASAQQNSGFHAPWVSCADSTGRFTGPKNVRTEPVRSSDGNLRAYAEISAGAGAHSECENTVRLFVSVNEGPYKQVFSQAPSLTSGTANSLGPVAWSPDGRWLAVEFGNWFYASDNASLGLLLYDRRTPATRAPDFIKQIERALGKTCSVELRSIAGFDSRGRVVLRVADRPDEEGHVSGCVRGTVDWLYDPGSGRAMPRTAR
jgi:hypothetical protein